MTFSRPGECLTNMSAVFSIEARPSFTETHTVMNLSAVPSVEAGPSYTDSHALMNMLAVPSVEAGPSYAENQSLVNTSAVSSVEEGRYYPDSHSMISIDCSSPRVEGNEISLSPKRQALDWVNFGLIEKSTIFKRRLHRTPRRRGGKLRVCNFIRSIS